MNPKCKVMVLDDEAIVGERLKPALEKAGFYVETFTESQPALDRLAVESSMSYLVTDLKMRKPDGLDVVHCVKQQAPGTKVIFITGFATVEGATQALRMAPLISLPSPSR